MPSTHRSSRPLLTLLVALGTLVARGAGAAESAYVYIAANPDHSPNAVTALLLNAGGFSALPGSPFACGGLGLAPSAGQEFAHRLVIAPSRNLLFAANDGSGTISAFTIDPASGQLTSVPGSPFAIKGWGAFAGISLAVSADGRFLYASGPSIVGLSVSASGALAEVGARWAFPERAPGIAVSPDNTRLFLAMPDGIAILHAGESGLAADEPNIVAVGSTAVDLGLNSTGTRLWVSTKFAGIQVYNIASGAPSFVPGSPFFSELSELGGLTVDNTDRFLIAYSAVGPRLLSAQSLPGGSLQQSHGSPLSPAVSPLSAALSPGASLLLDADGLGQVDAWLTDATGSLSHVSGYPLLSGAGPGFPNLVMAPAPTPAPATGRWSWLLAALLPLGGVLLLRQRRELARANCA